MPAPRRRTPIVLGLLLALTGCTSPEKQCRKENPTNDAAYEACWQTVLQQQNRELNRQDVRELHARGGD